MQNKYKILPVTFLQYANYKLIPVRDEDKFKIMQWRNEQIKALRQTKLLTIEDQSNYFKNTIAPLFDKEEPEQLIFSLLQNNDLIAYGGLVHINWKERSAEISFLNETKRSIQKDTFIEDWYHYLLLIIKLAKEYLNFNSIFTYAYDIRPNLYIALEKANFKETERIKNGITIDGELRDIVIHRYYLDPIKMRSAKISDVDSYFKWANDPLVRAYSYNQESIPYDSHVAWFSSKLNNDNFVFYVFENEKNEAIGQVRIEQKESENIIGISIDSLHRGFGYGSKMIRLACTDFYKLKGKEKITAYIKAENKASKAIFEKAGFIFETNIQISGVESVKYIYHEEN